MVSAFLFIKFYISLYHSKYSNFNIKVKISPIDKLKKKKFINNFS